MGFTAQELNNIASGALDFYVKGPAFAQTIQDKPLLAALEAGKKIFPGGKANISIPVKGDYSTAIQGYAYNDTVGYVNPANLKRVVYPWKEIHAGISFTGTELKIDGLSVTDSTTGANTSEHSGRDATVLTDLLEDKLDDMGEGWARTFQAMMWADGTQDAKQVPGIQSLIVDNPTVGTTGGLDRSTTTWWRNRSLVGANKITSSVSLQTLTKTLRAETRQLRRFAAKGSGTNYFIPCGSQFLAKLEAEVSEKGYYTQTGFLNGGKNDVGMAMISLKGIGDFVYDPTLDDLGYSYRCYVLDMNAIMLRPMDGEDKKTHNPARPFNQYVFYRAMTWTGGLTANQLNTSGVYEIAP